MTHLEALQFIDVVGRHTTAGCVLESMARTLSGIGIDLFCMNVLPFPGQQFEEVLLASKLPPDWLDLYIANGYVDHDPSLRHGKRVVHPYDWKDAPFDSAHEPRMLEVVQRARDFGIENGFVVPIPGPAGNVGNVWMGGHNIEIPDCHKPSLHLMALYAFAQVQRLTGKVRQTGMLSNREREILTWIAAGRSVAEISELLGLSGRTIEWHVQRSIEKLGARTRTNAVAIALREGIIAF
jgi:LuxR family quorum sensing-dependent transcriptional regulator